MSAHRCSPVGLHRAHRGDGHRVVRLVGEAIQTVLRTAMVLLTTASRPRRQPSFLGAGDLRRHDAALIGAGWVIGTKTGAW